MKGVCTRKVLYFFMAVILFVAIVASEDTENRNPAMAMPLQRMEQEVEKVSSRCGPVACPGRFCGSDLGACRPPWCCRGCSCSFCCKL
uniref:Xibalbin-2 n=1 Tax=Xibalbanus tulumensis TaxID=1519145 RepID=XIB2_XIBTU